jgi:hypothetical protein
VKHEQYLIVGLGDLQLQWTVAFKRLVHSFSEHIRTILPVIHESDRQGDRVTFVNLKCSVVACLTAEAELHLLLALSGRSESVRDYKHLTMKTVEVLRGLDQKDSEFLDPFMTVSHMFMFNLLKMPISFLRSDILE